VNDLPRQKLCEIITTYGHGLCEDVRKTEALLRDFCGEHKREIFVIITALEKGVVSNLLASQKDGLWEVTLNRLTKRLQDECSLIKDDARWAVESWALALKGIIPDPPREKVESRINWLGVLTQWKAITIVVDASESAMDTRRRIVRTVQRLLDRLPKGQVHALFFLGCGQAYSVTDFERQQADWFQQHTGRASLIAPVIQSLREQGYLDNPDNGIVIVGTGEVFDLADWMDVGKWLLIRTGKAPLVSDDLPVIEVSSADLT